MAKSISNLRSSHVSAALWPRLAGFAAVLMLTIGLPAAGDERETSTRRDQALAVRRFNLMRERVAAAEARSSEPDFPARFAAEPIFKYSDPVRGYVAAAVWKLGDTGRPRALLTSELDRKDHGAPCISYEYLSLTAVPFTLTSEDIRWAPRGTSLAFSQLPNAPAPEASPLRRLRQLREMARRFAAREDVKGERCELRLLASPVDRYRPSDAASADGAIFLCTFGTNPEVVLLIESDGKTWSYAAARMTGAQVVELTLDNRVVWKGAPLEERADSSFTGSITPIAIPGIAPDGTERRD